MTMGVGRTRAPRSVVAGLSFDGTYVGTSMIHKPDRFSFFSGLFPTGPAIARGAGLSYAAASFGRTPVSIDMRAFDRIIGLDRASNILEVETGAKLWDVHTFLAGQGLCLPVQPGHGAISIGGCIAADVHGKNVPKDGLFSDHVESLRLFHPDHGTVTVSREEMSAVFDATCGGFGTTGVILSARIRATVLPSRSVRMTTQRIENIHEVAPSLADAATRCDFLYTWHDFNRTGAALGNGYMVCGNFVRDADPGLIRPPKYPFPLTAEWRASGKQLYGAAVLPLLNFAYRRRLSRQSSVVQPVTDALFPLHGSERYFWFYGRQGFHEYQAIVPTDSFVAYYTEVQRIIRRSGICVPLVSAKLFSGTSDLLRFRGTGVCLALNLPRSGHSIAVLNEIDAVVREARGRPNIIKDSRLPLHLVESQFSDIDRLRTTLRTWDPARRFRSELTERLQL